MPTEPVYPPGLDPAEPGEDRTGIVRLLNGTDLPDPATFSARGPLPADEETVRRIEVAPRPLIVCLCGSTRFKAAFEKAAKAETLAGRIVLSVGFFGHQEDGDGKELFERSAEKKVLDELHFRKIEMADEILVVNDDLLQCKCGKPFRRGDGLMASYCCGERPVYRPYVGESTRNEIRHARRLGKMIRWTNGEMGVA